MKGIVFTEFLEMAESQFSIEVVEQMIERVDLPSKGIYTSVGTYDFQEMVGLVTNLSGLVGIPVPDLLKVFGRYLLGRFVVKFPDFFKEIKSTLDFLPRVESLVHLEVRKLYPDAELPTFSCTFPEPGLLKMTYWSSRKLPDLAEGLILGCAEHFGESLNISRTDLSGDSQSVEFAISVLSKK